jgi:hypothetical protein
MTNEHETLIGEIRSAFEGVSRGDGPTLHEANAVDDYATAAEQAAARALDVDQRWQDVPHEWIEEFSPAFFFLDFEGLRYYLPAVAIWDLTLGASSQSGSADVVEHLVLSTDREMIAILTDRQNRAVARWLRLRNDDSSYAEKISNSCWGKFSGWKFRSLYNLINNLRRYAHAQSNQQNSRKNDASAMGA